MAEPQVRAWLAWLAAVLVVLVVLVNVAVPFALDCSSTNSGPRSDAWSCRHGVDGWAFTAFLVCTIAGGVAVARRRHRLGVAVALAPLAVVALLIAGA